MRATVTLDDELLDRAVAVTELESVELCYAKRSDI